MWLVPTLAESWVLRKMTIVRNGSWSKCAPTWEGRHATTAGERSIPPRRGEASPPNEGYNPSAEGHHLDSRKHPLRRGGFFMRRPPLCGGAVLRQCRSDTPLWRGMVHRFGSVQRPRGECPRIAENAPRIDFAGRSVFYLLFSRTA